MKNNKINKRLVDSIHSDGRPQIIIWDSDLKGFGLRVTPRRKTYVVQSRIGGRTVRVTLGLHGPLTVEQARTEAKKHLGEMAKGINLNQVTKDIKTKSITLIQAYDAYIQSRVLTENTLRDYDKAIRLGFADWKNKPVQLINRTLVEDRFDKLSKNSLAQANQQFRFLRALLNFAQEKYTSEDGEPLIPSNPCDRLTTLKKWHRISQRTRNLETHQLKSWFETLETIKIDSEHRHTISDFCAFILLTGCREQEAARLKWQHVNVGNRSVTFTHTKNHRTHTLPIGEWLCGLLAKRKALKLSDTYVFPADNKYGHLKNHRKSIQMIAEKSGIPFTLHDLRRTFASIVNHQLERSFSLYTIKRLLNHSGADVTGGYIQFGIEDLREPMQLIESFVLRSAGLKSSSSDSEIVKTPSKVQIGSF